jgi:uncharacterized protein
MHRLNILVIGGTGFIGRTLCGTLLAAGHSISVLSRHPAPHSFYRDNITVFQADVSKPGAWQGQIPDYEVLINLTGASIFRRWNRQGKQEILDSRILTTRNIVEAMRKQKGSLKQLISISGVGYYGYHGDEIIDENSPPGSDFIARVAARWEAVAQDIKETGIRLVICRFGHVLGMQGGALPKLATLARLHLGSYWGNGNQWISWIHEKDLTGAILFLINTPAISGAVNITSPNPVRNREMMRILNKKTGSRVYIPPVPALALQLMLGQFSSVFINGQRVVPRVLQHSGFAFKFPDLVQALGDLLAPQHPVS